MKFHQMSTEELVKHFKTDIKNGLTQAEANKRLAEHGKNELEKPKKRSLLLRFIDQLKDFMILILFIAAILSFVTADYAEGILVIAIILINALLGVIQEAKAEKALESIQKLSSPHATVIRDGVELVLDVSDLVVGDIVLLEAGDYIPADLRIIESVNLKIDESILTGEAVPVDKKATVIAKDEVALGDRINSGYMSTVATYGRGVGLITGTGMNTEIGHIATMISVAKTDQTPLQRSIAKLGKTLAIIAVIVTLVIFGINIAEHYYFSSGAVGWEVWQKSFMASVALAVAAIPEGLPAIITIVLALGMQNLARHKAIMKSLPAVETLGSTSVICSDKTGTLTQNVMTVTQVFSNNKLLNVSSDLKVDDNLLKLLTFGVLCNDTKVNFTEELGYTKIGDPTETAFIDLAITLNQDPIKIFNENQRISELPFDSERKLMTTVHDFDDKRYAVIKGAPDVMFSRSSDSTKVIENYEKANLEMTNDALRVLAVGYKVIDQTLPLDDLTHNYLENEITLIGLVGMIDPPRPEVKDAIKVANRAGIDVIMITGDHKNTAMAIAKELNIIKSTDDMALSGIELDRLSDEEFNELLPHVRVYARVSPENKVRIVEAWKAHNKIVAMTGDGVNDAPALKTANIGIAMGITGTEVSKGAADMVLTDDNFTTIVTAVGEGRGIYANIKKAIHFLLSCNIGEIITIFLGTILGAFIFSEAVTTLTAVQILWVNLVTDSLMAIAIGLEPKEADIMEDKPRDVSKSFFANGLGIKISWQGLMLGILSFSAFVIGFFIYPNTEGATGDVLRSARLMNASTMTFMVLAISQLFHALNVKSERKSIFKTKLNKYLVGAFIISLTLQLLTIAFPFTRDLFGLSHLNAVEWLIVVGLAIIPIIVVEIQKLISNLLRKRKRA
ncbi:MAG: cation-translocating P-type ATPase [Acholeplasmataceae bacterium]|jgi:Ca2+-transporting ATPase